MSVVLPVSDAFADQEVAANSSTGTVAAAPEKVRVAVHVGNYYIDTALSAHAPLSVVMEGLVPFLVTTLRAESLAVEFDRNAVYSLAVEGALPMSRSESLADAQIRDGDLLILTEVRSTEVFKPIIEDRADALAEFNAVKFPAFITETFDTARVLGLASLVAGSLLSSVLLVAAWLSLPKLQWWLPPAGALTLVAVVGAVIAQRRRSALAVSYSVGMAALPVAFAAGWVAVPAYAGVHGQWTAANVLAGAFCVAAVSLIVVWLTGVGITVHTAVISLSVLGASAAAVCTFTAFDSRQIGGVTALLGLMLASSAEAIALLLARLRPSSLPAPGEDIDKSELEAAAMVVEVSDDAGVRTVALSDNDDAQLERQARVSNKYLTGLYVASALTVVVGAVAAVAPRTHYFYGELALALICTLIAALRARTLADRVHATTFYLSAFALVAGLTWTVVTGFDKPVAQLSVIGAVALATVGSALAGLMLPSAKLSPITKHRIEQLNFLIILVVAPLLMWTTGALNALRNLL